MKPPKLVYIAGPYRGKDAWETEQNVRRAETVAYAVAKAGAFPVCPHTNSRPYFNAAQPESFWMEGDIKLLRRCDAIFMCPDWKSSSGAIDEHEFAVQHLIPILKSTPQLRDWLEDTE